LATVVRSGHEHPPQHPIGSGFGATSTADDVLAGRDLTGRRAGVLALSPQLDGLGGLYWEDCEVAEMVAADDPGFADVRPYAVDPDQARRLWDLSAELTGVNDF
jgi:hypothetical protein